MILWYRSAMEKPFAKQLTDVMNTVLRPLGYRGSTPTWFRDTGATVAVINLQRSSWSETCYINIGLIVDRLGRPASIKERFCHLGLRAPYPDSKPSPVEAVLDHKCTEVGDHERATVLEAYLQDRVDPVLRRWEDVNLLREDFENGALKGAAIVIRLRDLLESGAR